MALATKICNKIDGNGKKSILQNIPIEQVAIATKVHYQIINIEQVAIATEVHHQIITIEQVAMATEVH